MQTRLFIYAVVDAAPAIDLTGPEVPRGIAGAALERVAFRDLAAVVSAVDSERFAADPAHAEAAASESLQTDLAQYQKVNFFLLAQAGAAGLLPLNFGLTAADGGEVERVLAQAYVQLRTHLDRLRGKIELVVQASWDLAKVLPAIARAHPELIDGDAVQTGRRLFEAADSQRRALIEAIHGAFAGLGVDFADGPRKTENLILNRSYLVERSHEGAFDSAINALADANETSLSFRYIGPLPAYSFVNIALKQGNFAVLDGARQTLGIPETASWGDIRARYRELLMALHPDRNPGDREAARRCREVMAAYELLASYCRSFPAFAAQGDQGRYSFAREQVEAVFVEQRKAVASTRGQQA